MIFDEFSSAAAYASLSPAFSQALCAMAELAAKPFQPGRTDPTEQGFYLISTQYDTKPLDTYARMEAHRQYVDIMYLLDGTECIYYKPVSQLKQETAPYSAEAEASLALVDDDALALRLNPGQMVIFFPQDAHCPCCCNGEASTVKKLICKFPVRQLTGG